MANSVYLKPSSLITLKEWHKFARVKRETQSNKLTATWQLKTCRAALLRALPTQPTKRTNLPVCCEPNVLVSQIYRRLMPALVSSSAVVASKAGARRSSRRSRSQSFGGRFCARVAASRQRVSMRLPRSAIGARLQEEARRRRVAPSSLSERAVQVIVAARSAQQLLCCCNCLREFVASAVCGGSYCKVSASLNALSCSR